MSQRPSLKLKLSTGSQITKVEPATSPPSTTPSASKPRLLLKVGGKSSQSSKGPPPPSLPAPSTAAKAPRKTKPTSKKRALEEAEISDNEEDVPLASASASASQPPSKRIKLKTGRTPSATQAHVNLKVRGKIPKRPKGIGYDSEASDREADPTITENFILRMQPGEDCDYLREAVANNNFGPRGKGGADVRLRFIRADARRAMLTIRGRHYAAALVDLPCVIEAMKSWEKKGSWMKSADVCQMLVVLGRIEKEEEAMNYDLPTQKGELDEKTWAWAHGLTPPMRWVRKRRFRKRISVKTVMEVESEVERLLRADEEAEGETTYEIIDEEKLRRQRDNEDIYDDGDQDAEGDEDEQGFIQTVEGDLDEDEDEMVAADLERAMAEFDDDSTPADPLTTATTTKTQHQLIESPVAATQSTPPSAAATPNASFDAPTPDAIASVTSATSDADAGEESSSDEDEMDEDQLEEQQDLQRQREEIADLEAAIKSEQAKMGQTANVILRKKLGDKIRGLQGDLELKMKAAGEGGD